MSCAADQAKDREFFGLLIFASQNRGFEGAFQVFRHFNNLLKLLEGKLVRLLWALNQLLGHPIKNN